MSQRTGGGRGSKSFNIFRFKAYFGLIQKTLDAFQKSTKLMANSFEKMNKKLNAQKTIELAQLGLLTMGYRKLALGTKGLVKDLETAGKKLKKLGMDITKPFSSSRVKEFERNLAKRLYVSEKEVERYARKAYKKILNERKILDAGKFERTSTKDPFKFKAGQGGQFNAHQVMNNFLGGKGQRFILNFFNNVLEEMGATSENVINRHMRLLYPKFNNRAERRIRKLGLDIYNVIGPDTVLGEIWGSILKKKGKKLLGPYWQDKKKDKFYNKPPKGGGGAPPGPNVPFGPAQPPPAGGQGGGGGGGGLGIPCALPGCNAEAVAQVPKANTGERFCSSGHKLKFLQQRNAVNQKRVNQMKAPVVIPPAAKKQPKHKPKPPPGGQTTINKYDCPVCNKKVQGAYHGGGKIVCENCGRHLANIVTSAQLKENPPVKKVTPADVRASLPAKDVDPIDQKREAIIATPKAQQMKRELEEEQAAKKKAEEKAADLQELKRKYGPGFKEEYPNSRFIHDKRLTKKAKAYVADAKYEKLMKKEDEEVEKILNEVLTPQIVTKLDSASIEEWAVKTGFEFLLAFAAKLRGVIELMVKSLSLSTDPNTWGAGATGVFIRLMTADGKARKDQNLVSAAQRGADQWQFGEKQKKAAALIEDQKKKQLAFELQYNAEENSFGLSERSGYRTRHDDMKALMDRNFAGDIRKGRDPRYSLLLEDVYVSLADKMAEMVKNTPIIFVGDILKDALERTKEKVGLTSTQVKDLQEEVQETIIKVLAEFKKPKKYDHVKLNKEIKSDEELSWTDKRNLFNDLPLFDQMQIKYRTKANFGDDNTLSEISHSKFNPALVDIATSEAQKKTEANKKASKERINAQTQIAKLTTKIKKISNEYIKPLMDIFKDGESWLDNPEMKKWEAEIEKLKKERRELGDKIDSEIFSKKSAKDFSDITSKLMGVQQINRMAEFMPLTSWNRKADLAGTFKLTKSILEEKEIFAGAEWGNIGDNLENTGIPDDVRAASDKVQRDARRAKLKRLRKQDKRLNNRINALSNDSYMLMGDPKYGVDHPIHEKLGNVIDYENNKRNNILEKIAKLEAEEYKDGTFEHFGLPPQPTPSQLYGLIGAYKKKGHLNEEQIKQLGEVFHSDTPLEDQRSGFKAMLDPESYGGGNQPPLFFEDALFRTNLDDEDKLHIYLRYMHSDKFGWKKGTLKGCIHPSTLPIEGGGSKYRDGYKWYCKNCGENFKKDPNEDKKNVMKFLFGDDGYKKGTQTADGWVKTQGGKDDVAGFIHGNEWIKVLSAGAVPSGKRPSDMGWSNGTEYGDKWRRSRIAANRLGIKRREKISPFLGQFFNADEENKKKLKEEWQLRKQGYKTAWQSQKAMKGKGFRARFNTFREGLREVSGIGKEREDEEAEQGIVRARSGPIKGITNLMKMPFKAFGVVVDKLEDRFPKLVKAIKGFAKVVMMGGLIRAFQGLQGIMAAMNPLSAIGETLNQIFSVFGEILGTAFTPLIEELFTVFFSDKAMAIIDTMVGLLSSVAEAMMPLVSSLLPLFDSLMKGMEPIVKAITDALYLLQPIFDSLSSALGQAFEALGPFIGLLIQGLVPVLNVLGNLLKYIVNIVTVVSRFLSAIFQGRWREAFGKKDEEGNTIYSDVDWSWSRQGDLPESMATGSFVTEPTIGLLGDNGYEGAVPMDAYGNIRSGGLPSSSVGGGGNTTIIINGNTDSSTVQLLNMEIWKKEIRNRRRII